MRSAAYMARVVAFLVLIIGVLACSTQVQQIRLDSTLLTEVVMLSGTGSDDAVEWEFYCDKGRNCGEWKTIAVPSNWELQGFGGYDYGHIREKHDEQGIYRRQFDVPVDWQGQTVNVVFDGVMTDATVMVNNKQVGPTHQGGFYRFSYDITSFLEFGKANEIKVIVDKISADTSIEAAERQADYWVFGGIFRQVFLEILPKSHIDWVNLDAKASGKFDAEVYIEDERQSVTSVSGQILTMKGEPVGDAFTAEVVGDKAVLSAAVKQPLLWTAETPNLYQVKLTLYSANTAVHSMLKTFGFRTFELKPHDGLYLNGEKIILKGVNRHSFRPDTGRTTSKQDSIDDIKLIKSMNMNAVRMSHYPPDVHFLEAADRLGIYVINELTTWQKPVLDTEPARRLVAQLVKRDQTHPSILMWANGNEGGWNTEVDDDYALYDLQNRPVLHPWELFRNIDTDHYPTYAELLAKGPQNEVFFPTEFLHGLYDGGHGAGLRDFWDFITSQPFGAGGFLWVLADEGVIRTDKDGVIDTDGNHAPDGIVGPYGEPEGSFFTIKEIWSPVQLKGLENGQLLPAKFDGTLTFENLYDFTDLSTHALTWSLYAPVTVFDSEAQVIDSGTLQMPSIAPNQTGSVAIALPDNWQNSGWLEVTVTNGHNEDVMTYSWPVQSAEQLNALTVTRMAESTTTSKPEIIKQTASELVVSVGSKQVIFDGKSGRLVSFAERGKAVTLTNGPRLLRSDNSLYKGQYNAMGTWMLHDPGADNAVGKPTRLITKEQGDTLIVDVENPPTGISRQRWIIHPEGYLSLDLDYQLDGEYIIHGIGFNYPQSAIAGKRWLGDGPYRVWANRLEGVSYAVWQNDYNEGVAGEDWQLPEFKGYFSDIQWLTLEGEEQRIHFSTPTQNLFVRVMQPEDGKRPDNTLALTYDGEISFLHRISAIGTKFHAAHHMGPQGQPVKESGTRNIKLTIFQ